ncbi:MAG: DUF488 family protein [Bacteroidota bacterium]|nr:DUF488 family protein [Bacteroidota bacterium]
MPPVIKIKRVYEKPQKKDGLRILVDRLWPRGMTKEEAGIDKWSKELAPSTDLRNWYGHDPEYWQEFQKRYQAELRKNKAVEDFMEAHEDQKLITLVYATKDSEHTHALVLQEYLQNLYAGD